MATLYRQLKPRPGYSGESIATHQRGRMHAAIIELVDRGGYDALTVGEIVDAAGVSKHTFYENFRDKEDCFLVTYTLVVRHTARQILAARSGEGAPEERVRAALLAVARDVAERPKEARFALVRGLEVPGEPKARRHATGLFAVVVAETLAEFDASTAPPSVLSRGIASGVGRVAHARLVAGSERALPNEVEELTRWVLSFRGSLPAQVCARRPPRGSPARKPRDGLSTRAPTTTPGDEREMILYAAARLVAEDAHGGLTVSRIRATAGISRRRFENYFDGVKDCIWSVQQQQAQNALDEIAGAYLQAGGWARGVHLAIASACNRLARDTILVRLGFSETLGPESLQWRNGFFSRLNSLLCAGTPVDQHPPPLAVEASIGGLMTLLHHFSAAGHAQRLPAICRCTLLPGAGPGDRRQRRRGGHHRQLRPSARDARRGSLDLT